MRVCVSLVGTEVASAGLKRIFVLACLVCLHYHTHIAKGV